jgi:hypothetical protein
MDARGPDVARRAHWWGSVIASAVSVAAVMPFAAPALARLTTTHGAPHHVASSSPAGAPAARVRPRAANVRGSKVVRFGDSVIGASGAPRRVSVRNVGTGPATFEPALIFGAAAGDFSIVGDKCSHRTIAAGVECALQIVFTPHGDGTRTAQVGLRYGAGSVAGVSLTGAGHTAALTSVRHDITVDAIDAPGSPCPDGGGISCFGVQQNLIVHPGNFLVQNVYFIRNTVHGYEAAGGYWIWDFGESCGSSHRSCELTHVRTDYVPLGRSFRLTLQTTVTGNVLTFVNSAGALAPYTLPVGDAHIAYDDGNGKARTNPDLVFVGQANGTVSRFTQGLGTVRTRLGVTGMPSMFAPITTCTIPTSELTYTLEDSVGLSWSNDGAGNARFGAGTEPGVGLSFVPAPARC